MITGVILAGGMSTRMGCDKASLPVGQRTLIEHVLRHARPHVQRVLIVANAQNAPRLRRLDAEVVVDLQPGYGPLMGIFTALMHAETPLAVCIPCDMPWVHPRLIDRLVGAHHQGIDCVAGLHPWHGLQPFPLVCHVTSCRTIGALLNRGARSLQAFCASPRARLVRIHEPNLWRSFTNVNTVAEYAKLAQDPAAHPSRADRAHDLEPNTPLDSWSDGEAPTWDGIKRVEP